MRDAAHSPAHSPAADFITVCAAGSVLLKNIASGHKARMLPLDEHAGARIVVAGPMVRHSRVLSLPLIVSVICWLERWSTQLPADTAYILSALQAHTTEYLLGNYYGIPAGEVITPFRAIKVGDVGTHAGSRFTWCLSPGASSVAPGSCCDLKAPSFGSRNGKRTEKRRHTCYAAGEGGWC